MRRVVAFLIIAGAAGGCADPPVGPDPDGTLRIAVRTSGADLDLDGYGLTIDGRVEPPVGPNETLVVPGLETGSHSVRLTGVAANCLVDGTELRPVTVTDGDTTEVAYAVTCRATGVAVTAATTGADQDPDGYQVSIDAEDPEPLGTLGSVIVTRLAPGPHTVTLSGLAANCTVGGDNPRAVVVMVGEVIPVSFAVTCAAVTGALAVRAPATGLDLDDSFVIQVAGQPPQAVRGYETVVFTGLAPGIRWVSLGDLSPNCTVVGDNPQTVTVTVGDTVQVTFEAACTAATGVVQVSATTSGADYDLDGYTIRMDPGGSQSLGPNTSVTYGGVAGGDHILTLEGVASNCTVSGDNPRTVSVTIGGTTIDTARATFAVACARTWEIAYAHPDSRVVYVSSLTADAPQGAFTSGAAPAWSPDGTRLVYAGIRCDYYDDYYDSYNCYSIGLVMAGTSGIGVDTVTRDFTDTDPTWRPDGGRIAFIRGTTLYLVNPDGSGLTPVLAAGTAAIPDWSPDGSAIAFTCQVDGGNQDICVINADGSGLTRLTSDAASDTRPAWSPDGSRIVFVTTRYSGMQELALMSPDGSAVTRLSPGTGALQPTWSTDGTRIAYTAVSCDVYSGCAMHGLFVMNADGTGATQISSGRHIGVAWRP